MARRPKIYEIISIFRDEDDGDDIFRSRISAFFKFETLSLFWLEKMSNLTTDFKNLTKSVIFGNIFDGRKTFFKKKFYF